jgi:phosphoribosylanthranilate isomerase
LKVKICGLTSFEDAALCAELGADYLGLVFYSGSPRYLPENQAAEIIRQVKDYCRENNLKTPQFVAVYVAEGLTPEQIAANFLTSGVDILQLHKLDSLKELNRLKAGLPHTKIILAQSLSPGLEPEEPISLRDAADFILCDTSLKNCNHIIYGGTGKTFDWELLKGLQPAHLAKTLVAGGISKDNLKLLLQIVTPYGIDLCSAVEEKPGRKSKEKLEAFFEEFNQNK